MSRLPRRRRLDHAGRERRILSPDGWTLNAPQDMTMKGTRG